MTLSVKKKKKKRIQQQQQEKQVKNRSLILLLLQSRSNRTCPPSLREGAVRLVGYLVAVVQSAMQFIYLETTASESLFTIHLLIVGRSAAAPSASAAAAASDDLDCGFFGTSAAHGWLELLVCMGESVGFCKNAGNHESNRQRAITL